MACRAQPEKIGKCSTLWEAIFKESLLDRKAHSIN